MAERTRVMVGECRCPGSPHPEDWVELAPSVPIMVGSAVLSAIRAAGDDEARLTALMAKAYVHYGVRAWSFVDDDGRPILIDASAADWPDTVERLLPWDRGGALVADAADTLYSEVVLRPLLARTSSSSQAGPMAGSTSPTPATGRKRQKRSSRSSRTDTGGKLSVVPAP